VSVDSFVIWAVYSRLSAVVYKGRFNSVGDLLERTEEAQHYYITPAGPCCRYCTTVLFVVVDYMEPEISLW
jgi:hypothetical protein